MVNAANEMGVFERVIERGSFAAAAQDVGLSPSAVSKLIMRLEQRLGVRLINRTTRRLAVKAEVGPILSARGRYKPPTRLQNRRSLRRACHRVVICVYTRRQS